MTLYEQKCNLLKEINEFDTICTISGLDCDVYRERLADTIAYKESKGINAFGDRMIDSTILLNQQFFETVSKKCEEFRQFVRNDLIWSVESKSADQVVELWGRFVKMVNKLIDGHSTTLKLVKDDDGVLQGVLKQHCQAVENFQIPKLEEGVYNYGQL